MNHQDMAKNTLMQENVCFLHMELSRREIPFLQKEFKDEAEKQAYEKYQRDIAACRAKEQEEELRVLRAYGKLKYDKTITRDIIVPAEMPLYAVHYMIQRAFGWQNSHLHRFRLPEERFLKITEGKTARWLDLMGVLFSSPLMDDEDRFWADDYESGSFRNWLRRKYTGPYISLNYHEGIVTCSMDKEYILQKWPEAEQKPVQNIFEMFEEDPNQLLERLPIGQVLAPATAKNADKTELADSFEAFLDSTLKAEIFTILERGMDDPAIQPSVKCCTDMLCYEYDFGDGWFIEITARDGCDDLLRSGRVKAADVDNAVRTVCKENRPVCIASDGLPVLDDVGGIDGYIRFLRGINKQSEWAYWAAKVAEEGGSKKEIPKRIPDNWDYDNEDSIEWAASLGWNGRMSRPEKLL